MITWVDPHKVRLSELREAGLQALGRLMGKQLIWIEDDERRNETLAVSVRLVQIARTEPGMPTDLRRFLVDKAIWYWTEDRLPSRKFNLRYRSRSALALQQELGLKKASPQLQHEHVHERKYVIDLLLTDSKSSPELVIRSCVACVVTRPEHAQLRDSSAGTMGWLRYRKAGVEVLDLLTGEPADLEALVRQDASQLDAGRSGIS